MGPGLLMVALGVGSSVAAIAHVRDRQRGGPNAYPLLYDLLGAVGFLAFGVGTLLNISFFTGSGRWWLLLLLLVALDKWRRTLSARGSAKRK